MAAKRFLNVQYGGQPERIKIADMEDLSEVRDKVKEKYELTRGSAYIQLWKKTTSENTLIEGLGYTRWRRKNKDYAKSTSHVLY